MFIVVLNVDTNCSAGINFSDKTCKCSKIFMNNITSNFFNSRQKYEHNSPWPAFSDTIHPDSVAKHLESPRAYKVCEVHNVN